MRINNTQTNYFYGDAVFQGGLSALSGATFTNTVFTSTSALSVINTGIGPALYVAQAAGNYDIASFYDKDGIEILHVGNAPTPGSTGKIGINESNPGAELTVKGAISGSDGITVAGGNSNQWNTAYAFTTNSPLVTSFLVPNIPLGTVGNYPVGGFYTVPAGKKFVATNLSILFDNGNFTNGGTAVNVRGIINNANANTITPQLQIAASTVFSTNTLRRVVWTGSDNFLYAVAGDYVQVRISQAGAAYTASALVDGLIIS